MQAEKTLSELERAISEARKQCDEATAGECAAAWDTVEELSAAISHKKAQVRFCYLMLSCLHSMFWSFCCNLIDLTFHLAGTIRVEPYRTGVNMQDLIHPRSQLAQVGVASLTGSNDPSMALPFVFPSLLEPLPVGWLGLRSL